MKPENPPQVEGTSVHSTSTPDEKTQDGDVALAFIEQHGQIEYTPEQEKAVIRKIDLALMPLVNSKPISVSETLWTNVATSF
jgi:uncharacterized membrane protein YcaP (DUF421 family)